MGTANRLPIDETDRGSSWVNRVNKQVRQAHVAVGQSGGLTFEPAQQCGKPFNQFGPSIEDFWWALSEILQRWICDH